MTTQKSLKRRVRSRMAKTGERYTAARRQVLTAGAAEPPETPPETPVEPAIEREAEPVTATQVDPSIPAYSDEIVLAKTGRRRQEWFTLLDAWGAPDRTHTEIAAWLSAEHGVPSWWRQGITVDYERAIGRRRLGQHADGYSVGATKTVGVPLERLFNAFVDEEVRARWLTGVSLRLRTATRPRTARFDVDDGATRLAVGFDVPREGRSRIAIAHEKLPDEAAAARWRPFWRAALLELQVFLEG